MSPPVWGAWVEIGFSMKIVSFAAAAPRVGGVG